MGLFLDSVLFHQPIFLHFIYTLVLHCLDYGSFMPCLVQVLVFQLFVLFQIYFSYSGAFTFPYEFYFVLFIYYFLMVGSLFWGGAIPCGMQELNSLTRLEPMPRAMEVQKTNHWTSRESPSSEFQKQLIHFSK